MKKTLIATLTAVTLTAGAISGGAFAHKGGKGPEGAVERLTERLNLTEEQQVQMKEIFDQKILDRKNMMESTTAEQRENLRENARDAMKAQTESQIKALLTPEQVALFDQMHAEKEARGDREHKGKKGHGEGKGWGKRGDHGEEKCDD